MPKTYAFFLTDSMLKTITASLALSAVHVEDDPKLARIVNGLRDTLLMQRGAAVDVEKMTENLNEIIERLRA